MEQQIADLITVLSRPDWIPFNQPENQVVATFFTSAEPETSRLFFHQLLLSVELYYRVHSHDHSISAKKRLLLQLPEKIAWDLALAGRWIENVGIERPKSSAKRSSINFRLLSKETQVKAIKNFAWTLKYDQEIQILAVWLTLCRWPNMVEVEYVIDEKDKEEKPIEERSADTMSWFTGVVLPGKSMPWLIMKSLIDCDRDTQGKLQSLSHLHHCSGFQYRANTYWSWECVVGKVLGAAAGVNQIAGWIGPCYYAPVLDRIEVVNVLCDRPSQRLSPDDVDFMSERSNALGEKDDSYPAGDYELVLADTENVENSIRVEKIGLKSLVDQRGAADREGRMPTLKDAHGVGLYRATVVFAIDGMSWPVHLAYDVEFISAFPCHNGPHVLHKRYRYSLTKIADFADFSIRDLPGSGDEGSPSGDKGATRKRTGLSLYNNEVQSVLAVEAFGISDNEVLARAVVSHEGVSAITADLNRTCAACAIREAYAACISVVILTKSGANETYEDIDRCTDQG
jgi:hypothetical protein